MSASGRKGDRRERELVNEAGDRGLGAMRCPSSGSATTRSLPDVLIGTPLELDSGRGERVITSATYAVEVKAKQRGEHIYLDEREVAELHEFADAFGARALIGVRYDYEDWRFYRPDDLHRTDGGNYRVRYDDESAELFEWDALIAAHPI